MTPLPPPLPTKEQIALLPLFEGLEFDRIRTVDDDDAAAQALARLLGEPVLGFDTESRPTFVRDEVSDGPHVVQFATLDQAWLFRLRTPGCRQAVSALLAAKDLIKAGFGLENDRTQLMRSLGGPLHGLLDLDAVLRRQGHRKAVGVKTAVALLFGQRFVKSKKVGTSNWSQPELTEAQQRYAANDAYAALRVYQALQAADPTHPLAEGAPAAQPEAPDSHSHDDGDPLQVVQTTPLLRIFDPERALAFYCGFLGFRLDWEHRFDDTAPRYLQVSRGGCVLHLTEHHGDCSPAATVFVRCRGLRAYHRTIAAQRYPFMRPSIESAPWGDDLMTVTDPFGNRIRFAQDTREADAAEAAAAARGRRAAARMQTGVGAA
ncbi:glyoxalase superfamily protein [uncultured Xylophilus sp.]|uniref:glyoxalase superfamily protein n=1 Tax=uncultured Xylophilus sp. TaxID=296832 RepID=UPI0034566A2C